MLWGAKHAKDRTCSDRGWAWSQDNKLNSWIPIRMNAHLSRVFHIRSPRTLHFSAQSIFSIYLWIRLVDVDVEKFWRFFDPDCSLTRSTWAFLLTRLASWRAHLPRIPLGFWSRQGMEWTIDTLGPGHVPVCSTSEWASSSYAAIIRSIPDSRACTCPEIWHARDSKASLKDGRYQLPPSLEFRYCVGKINVPLAAKPGFESFKKMIEPWERRWYITKEEPTCRASFGCKRCRKSKVQDIHWSIENTIAT